MVVRDTMDLAFGEVSAVTAAAGADSGRLDDDAGQYGSAIPCTERSIRSC